MQSTPAKATGLIRHTALATVHNVVVLHGFNKIYIPGNSRQMKIQYFVSQKVHIFKFVGKYALAGFSPNQQRRLGNHLL